MVFIRRPPRGPAAAGCPPTLCRFLLSPAGAYRLFVAVARPAVAQAYPLFVQREITTGSPPTSPNSPRDSTLAALPGSRLSRA